MRPLNQAGIDLIKSFEGFSAKPYLCPAKVATIGYGTTVYPDGQKVSLTDPEISKQQAEALLVSHVNSITPRIEKLLLIDVNDNEFAALVSFAYNVGETNLAKSTLLQLLNKGIDKKIVAEQFLRWNRAGGKVLAGLTRRRQAEQALFLHQDNDDLEKDNSVDLKSI